MLFLAATANVEYSSVKMTIAVDRFLITECVFFCCVLLRFYLQIKFEHLWIGDANLKIIVHLCCQFAVFTTRSIHTVCKIDVLVSYAYVHVPFIATA